MRSLSAVALFLVVWTLALFAAPPPVLGHGIHYEARSEGISVKIFYGADDPAGDSAYEIFGPGDVEAYQVGRTSRAGIISFLPDRPGLWKIKILGESSHGFHGVTIETQVDQAFQLESFHKPLVARYTKVIVGISIIFGLFGLYALWRSRPTFSASPRTGDTSKPQGENES